MKKLFKLLPLVFLIGCLAGCKHNLNNSEKLMVKFEVDLSISARVINADYDLSDYENYTFELSVNNKPISFNGITSLCEYNELEVEMGKAYSFAVNVYDNANVLIMNAETSKTFTSVDDNTVVLNLQFVKDTTATGDFKYRLEWDSDVANYKISFELENAAGQKQTLVLNSDDDDDALAEKSYFSNITEYSCDVKFENLSYGAYSLKVVFEQYPFAVKTLAVATTTHIEKAFNVYPNLTTEGHHRFGIVNQNHGWEFVINEAFKDEFTLTVSKTYFENYNRHLELPVPVAGNTHYQFIGWKCMNEAGNEDYSGYIAYNETSGKYIFDGSAVNESVVFTALFEPILYTVTFHSNFGTADITTTQKFTVESTDEDGYEVTIAPGITVTSEEGDSADYDYLVYLKGKHPYYTFHGWATTATATTATVEQNQPYNATADVDLYAVWTYNGKYTADGLTFTFLNDQYANQNGEYVEWNVTPDENGAFSISKQDYLTYFGYLLDTEYGSGDLYYYTIFSANCDYFDETLGDNPSIRYIESDRELTSAEIELEDDPLFDSVMDVLKGTKNKTYIYLQIYDGDYNLIEPSDILCYTFVADSNTGNISVKFEKLNGWNSEEVNPIRYSTKETFSLDNDVDDGSLNGEKLNFGTKLHVIADGFYQIFPDYTDPSVYTAYTYEVYINGMKVNGSNVEDSNAILYTLQSTVYSLGNNYLEIIIKDPKGKIVYVADATFYVIK